jgi:hypothetical protein
MTAAAHATSCDHGEAAAPEPDHEVVVCERCWQRLPGRPVDLTRYRRQRPAGPVPCFTGPHAPADVLPFRPRPRPEGGTP